MSNKSIKQVDSLFEELIDGYSEDEITLLKKAFDLASDGHSNQKRLSGEPYVTHPLHVAIYLSKLSMDIETIVSAILHDLIEDTDITYSELKKEFGKEIADIVDGVTKLDKINYNSKEEAKADAIRKMVIAMSKDIRVLILKLADRLHNIETIDYLNEWKKEKIAQETLYVYAPLAHRLGLQNIKHTLEDVSFNILFKNQNEEINNLISKSTPNRDKNINESLSIIKKLLTDNSLSAEVVGRPKHNYSIYKKIINNGLSFNEINDLIGIRILTDDVKNCYTILGLIHANFQPVLGRFKDFISMPKFNLYQSLHTTVLTTEGQRMEIQIRTHDMHYRAEFGVASHWKYKEQPKNDLQEWTNDLNSISEEYPEPNEFLSHMKLDLYEQEIFCLTPNGDVITLPTGASPVDFAFAVHTQVGEKLIGAKINGKLVNLGTLLKTGDTVEILTTKDQSKIIEDMIDDYINNIITECIPPKKYSHEWDSKILNEKIEETFHISLPFENWFEEEGVDEEEIVKRIKDQVNQKLKDKKHKYSEELFEFAEKRVMLFQIDKDWREHLAAMDMLRGSVNLRAMGGKDPFFEYKKESFNYFDEMLTHQNQRVLRTLFGIELINQSNKKDNNTNNKKPPNRIIAKKIGRNDACPCGSGKKYKVCHGS